MSDRHPDNPPCGGLILRGKNSTDSLAWDRNWYDLLPLVKLVCMKLIRIGPHHYNKRVLLLEEQRRIDISGFGSSHDAGFLGGDGQAEPSLLKLVDVVKLGIGCLAESRQLAQVFAWMA